MSDTKIKIMIADDHLAVMQSIITRLNDENNIIVTGQATNGKQLIDLIAKDEPDIALVDLEMPIMTGAEAVRIIASAHPKVRPIMLSGYYSEYFISELVKMGACAYLAKNFDIDEVILTINKVYQDGYYFNKKVAKLVVSEQEKKTFENIIKQISLTEREVEVLTLVCKEKSNKEIALQLNITYDTVDFHRKNIYKKTNSSNVVGLVKYAIKSGIVDYN
jgi:DNA-binding NarL/FixJ family response regulator